MVDRTDKDRHEPDQPIGFGSRLAGSPAFKALFREGMALVEETATYLDGEGRGSARHLSRTGSLAYASESMRLTTRLMQLASWLLLQRSVNEGELTPDQARAEAAKVKLGGFETATEGPGWDDLPETLKDLIMRSISLQKRVLQLDQAIHRPIAPPVEGNAVARQIGQLHAAFGQPPRD